MEPDFGGYATKAGLRCSDKRVITAQAFKHMDGVTVPLVWQHGHKETSNVLGHARLEAREDGMYAYGFFNETPNGNHAKAMVQHGDITALSIYAVQLKEANNVVQHGRITEVSLVLSGANPGALIDHVKIQHSDDPDDVVELPEEAIISHMGEIELLKADDKKQSEKNLEHASTDGKTGLDVYNTLNDEQKSLVDFMLGAALDSKSDGDDVKHSNDDESEKIAHQEGAEQMPRNVFEQAENKETTGGTMSHSLTKEDIKGIVDSAQRSGSLKHAVTEYALAHGIENIDVLFPDAKNVTGAPDLETRRMEWVSDVLNGTHKTPFSRIKTFHGDLTQDDARAKGYIKGNYKLEEWFGVTKRSTGPTTIYKKQKLDRDDIIDITDFDIVAWLKAEMRMMIEEEFARAVLIGDGRSLGAEDKIKDPAAASEGNGIRSILNDHELFVTTIMVNTDADGSAGGAEDYEKVVDAVMDGMEFYKGSGTPTLYTTIRQVNAFLKAKDANGRRYYTTKQQVADMLGVKRIVTVEPMQTQAPDVIGIIVNLDDYNVGTDRGGEMNFFDDFDIDYNKYTYLMEGRSSGALTKIKSALVIKKTPATSVLVAPTKPSFVPSTGVITIPTQTGVVYKNSSGTTLTAGAQTALAPGASATIFAVAASGYHFANTVEDSWSFKRNAS